MDVEAYLDCRSYSGIVSSSYRLGHTGSRDELCLRGGF